MHTMRPSVAMLARNSDTNAATLDMEVVDLESQHDPACPCALCFVQRSRIEASPLLACGGAVLPRETGGEQPIVPYDGPGRIVRGRSGGLRIVGEASIIALPAKRKQSDQQKLIKARNALKAQRTKVR